MPLVLSWLLQAWISLPKIKIVEIITNWTFVEVVVGNYYNGRALKEAAMQQLPDISTLYIPIRVITVFPYS